MGRRGATILEDLMRLPWWVSAACSGAAFVVLRFVVALFIPAGPATSANYALKGILGGIGTVAPLVALFLLIPAPIAALRQWRERRLLDSQDGLATIRTLSWQRFETLVGEAYRRQGYAVSRPSRDGGPDGGVDLILRKDGSTVLVQCKQWKAWKVGVPVVREVFGVMAAQRVQRAIIVTSGVFTQDARAFAAGKPIDLIEGSQLAELIRAVQASSAPTSPSTQTQTPVAHAASLRSSAHSSQTSDTAKPPDPPTAGPTRTCPKCGAAMVLRTAKQGPSAGRQFWGCSRFPQCRATEPLSE
jgi:restriction system protein